MDLTTKNIFERLCRIYMRRIDKSKLFIKSKRGASFILDEMIFIIMNTNSHIHLYLNNFAKEKF